MSNVFLVFAKSDLKNKENVMDECILLQEKFSWKACCFTSLWLLYNKLWKLLAVYVVIVLLLFAASTMDYITSDLTFLGFLIVSIYIGLFSSTILQKNLIRKKKYSLKSVILADNKESALSKYLSFFKD
jgi:hypothetical protein